MYEYATPWIAAKMFRHFVELNEIFDVEKPNNVDLPTHRSETYTTKINTQ